MELTKEQKIAILVIKNYLNRDFTDEYILFNFELAIDELIETSTRLKTMKVTGMKSKSEGNQSMTFSDNIEAWIITPNVSMLLPQPYIKLMG